MEEDRETIATCALYVPWLGIGIDTVRFSRPGIKRTKLRLLRCRARMSMNDRDRIIDARADQNLADVARIPAPWDAKPASPSRLANAISWSRPYSNFTNCFTIVPSVHDLFSTLCYSFLYGSFGCSILIRSRPFLHFFAYRPPSAWCNSRCPVLYPCCCAAPKFLQGNDSAQLFTVRYPIFLRIFSFPTLFLILWTYPSLASTAPCFMGVPFSFILALMFILWRVLYTMYIRVYLLTLNLRAVTFLGCMSSGLRFSSLVSFSWYFIARVMYWIFTEWNYVLLLHNPSSTMILEAPDKTVVGPTRITSWLRCHQRLPQCL